MFYCKDLRLLWPLQINWQELTCEANQFTRHSPLVQAVAVRKNGSTPSGMKRWRDHPFGDYFFVSLDANRTDVWKCRKSS